MRRAALALALLTGCAALLGAQVPAGRLPVPDAAAQAAADRLIKRILADDYAEAARDATARARLPRLLCKQGRATKDDDALRFVLLREARDLAARQGDAPMAVDLARELARDFAVDEREMTLDTLLAAAPAAETVQANRGLAVAALTLLDDLLAADRHAAAARLLPLTETAAGKAEDERLLGDVRRRTAEARRLQVEYGRVRAAAAKLRTNPTDPQANLALGRYRALACGDWERALPLLARGSDAVLKALAQRDLARPAGAGATIELAQDWRRLINGSPDAAQAQFLVRSAYWYQQAALRLEGDDLARVEKALRAVVDALPSGYAVPGYFEFVRRFEGHQGNVTGVAFRPDGRRLLTCGGDRTVRLWDVETGRQRRRVGTHADWARCVAFAADGRRGVSAGDDSTVRLWDVAAGRELRRFKGHTEWVRCTAFLPDGGVVSGSDDGTLRLWDAATGSEVRRFEGHKGYVTSVAVSRDGRRLLSAGTDESVRLWDVDGGKELRRLDGHRGNVNGVSLAPDGRRGASAGSDGTVRLWDVESGKEVRRLTGHKGTVWCVAFAPDGRVVLSGGADGTARLWEAATGRELRRLRGHSSLVLSVAFAPDGRWVATGSADKTARLWAVPGR